MILHRLRGLAAATLLLAGSAVAALAGGVSPVPLGSGPLDQAFGSAVGSMLCRSSSGWTIVAAGSAAQVLTVPSGGGCPAWATPASGGNVSTTGSPASGQIASFTNATTVQGINVVPVSAGGTGAATASGGLLALLGAQASTVPTASATLAATDIERDAYPTGSITLTMPNGGAGWRSGIITNDNAQAGLVTLAVPSGATLDGVTNGTTVLYPYQRARIRQTGATAYRTDWVDRSPLVYAVAMGTAAASAAVVLPVGYTKFEVTLSAVAVTTAGATVLARVADANGTKTGANDYTNLRNVAYGSTVAAVSSSDTWFNLVVSSAVGANKALVRMVLYPGTDNANVPNFVAETLETDNTPQLDLITFGGYYNGATSGTMLRASQLILGPSTGNFTCNITVRGIP